MTETIVFCGPTIAAAVARRTASARYVGPAAQGDIHRATKLNPDTIVLIDGFFERVPAVSHKELLAALDRGIRVIGCSSMGALRAAELAKYGMEGAGAVYELYANGALEDDDEVALIHAPRQLGYRPLSEPMVNIRATLQAAVQAGVISAPAADDLIDKAKSLYYPNRQWGSFLPARDRALASWVREHRIDQKQRDAHEGLKRIPLNRPAPSAPFLFEKTVHWDRICSDTCTGGRRRDAF